MRFCSIILIAIILTACGQLGDQPPTPTRHLASAHDTINQSPGTPVLIGPGALGPLAYWTPISVTPIPTLTPRPTYTPNPTYTPFSTPTPTLDEMYHWIQLSGPWGGSWYTDDNGDTRHGAAANGFIVEDAHNPGNIFPLYVDDVHYGIAMPTAAFYGLPVKVCFKGECVIATAVDVMRHPRVCHSDWECYNMIDLWPQTKRALGFPDIFYDTTGEDLQVYVGKLKHNR